MEKINQGITPFCDWKIKKLITGVILVLAFFTCRNVYAQNISLISDEETEQLLGKITAPLYKAAGVKFNRNEIYIVDDPTLNAFVADGNNLFIHTGTIINADSPNELAGVIAHETGHIAGGHILRQKLKNREMQEVTLASAILAGTAAAVSGRSDAAMAVLLGSQSSAISHYTKYRTEEERSADDAAISLLDKTQQSPEGMLTFMKRISKQNTLNGIQETPYFRTHPVTTERITFFEQAVKESPFRDDQKLQENFNRVKAKLYAYLNQPAVTLKKYPLKDKSITARYAQSIAYFKQLNLDQALKIINSLIKDEPQNPFFHELKAQVYLETGQIKQAKEEYQKAYKLLPDSYLMQISLAQAILEDNPTPAEVNEAVNLLSKALIKRPAGFSWLLLSRAYGLQGNQAAANYAAAEYSLRIGATDTARRQALEAKNKKPNPKLALKIEDLLSRTEQILKNN